MPDKRQLRTAAGALRVLADFLAAVAKYALTGFMVLISIWLIGRVMEALQGNTIFDPVLTRRLGVFIWILLAIWIIGWGIGSAKALLKAERRWRAVVPWAFFLILFAAVLVEREGFQVSSSGLLATLSGSAESSRQASFLLFKFHPANPMLAANVIALKLRGTANLVSLAPYVWSWNALFVFFIWSLAYGIFLLRHGDNVWPKAMHLSFAVCGLGILLLLKSIFPPPMTWQMASLHAAAATLLVFQVLLTYAALRSFAGPEKENPEEPDPFSDRPEKEKTDVKRHPLGLPPPALKITLFLFIVLPILADLHHQSELASSSAGMMTEIAGHKMSISDLMTVAPISVHAGPAMGDGVVGVLPKGTRVPVVKKNTNG
jgi:hypothetical protein